ncbi:hypothetical protein DAPPUDRAFT_269372 [Daphnia pulex]|uniref:Uncharacterized protein n=1 Tax=Daphnia pulex TaxID=6669 RepID=E9HZ86_DAPPU|nr:hypothetical protein DAPPUDRAFT_269372 [Daphnia pulex]|eukprot:EFX62944.1 hypothetical protein DAPPUDRAFT_269372 [Daphnia pulex]
MYLPFMSLRSCRSTTSSIFGHVREKVASSKFGLKVSLNSLVEVAGCPTDIHEASWSVANFETGRIGRGAGTYGPPVGGGGERFRHTAMIVILICFGDDSVYLEMNDAFRCDLLSRVYDLSSRACDPLSRAFDPCRTFGLGVLFYQMINQKLCHEQPQKAGGFVNRDSQDNALKSTHYRKAPNRYN